MQDHALKLSISIGTGSSSNQLYAGNVPKGAARAVADHFRALSDVISRQGVTHVFSVEWGNYVLLSVSAYSFPPNDEAPPAPTQVVLAAPIEVKACSACHKLEAELTAERERVAAALERNCQIRSRKRRRKS